MGFRDLMEFIGDLERFIGCNDVMIHFMGLEISS